LPSHGQYLSSSRENTGGLVGDRIGVIIFVYKE
jgi:hypothetical protein